MQDVVMVLVIASFAIYAACLLLKRGASINFLSLIVSTCATMGIITDRADLGDYFLVALIPMIYIVISSIASLVIIRRE